MIVGEIDANLEARVTLSLIHGECRLDVLFLVDSGFNGYLAVPQSIVGELTLRGRRSGVVTIHRRLTSTHQSRVWGTSP